MATARTGIAGRKQGFFSVALHRSNGGHAISEFQCRLEGFCQSQLEVIAHFEAVHHHIDPVFFLLVECGDVIEVYHNAVDPHADETRGPHLLKHVQMFALAVTHHRGEQHEFAAFGHREDGIHHLRNGLCFQRDTVGWAARIPHPGKQQPQVVVDLGDGADRGPRVMRGRFLLDRNGGRQAFDMVDVRLFHHRQKLPRVGRQ